MRCSRADPTALVQVIQALRGWTTVPIIVVSGRTGSADKADALDAGADD
jgi:two-component system KDP operon response regulator KdpE